MAKKCKESFDRAVDRTSDQVAEMQNEINDLNDALTDAQCRSVRQTITIIELARILGVEYGRK